MRGDREETEQSLPVASLEELYPKLRDRAFGPGWNKSSPSLWNQPRRTYAPAAWRYREARSALQQAGDLISTELAERRNLILVNPVVGNDYATTNTLVSAYQMIMPGEFARSHRHAPNALRLVLDATPGLYTVVDEQKVPMATGDVVLTPNWCWHGHGNEGTANGYWIDFLDVPLVQRLEPMFFEPLRPDTPPVQEVDQSPFRFRWQDTRASLKTAPPDPTGRALAQIRLDTPALKTFELYMLKLGAAPTVAFRSTANSIYAVVEGHGATTIEGRRFDWARGDVIAVPSWCAHSHCADPEAVLFRVTDEQVMKRLGFFREETAAA